MGWSYGFLFFDRGLCGIERGWLRSQVNERIRRTRETASVSSRDTGQSNEAVSAVTVGLAPKGGLQKRNPYA